MEKKICNRCLIDKELSDFNKNSYHKDGYNSICKYCIKEPARLRYILNKEKRKEYDKNNLEHIKEVKKEYYKNNSKTIKLKNKNYRLNNKEKRNLTICKYRKEKRKTDKLYHLTSNIRSLIRNSFKKNGYTKNTKTASILGCSHEFLLQYIEGQWILTNNLDENGCVWMSWENYGNPKDGILEFNKSWDIDHIEPLANGICELDIIRLNHYTNLQPLCSKINRVVKKDSYLYTKKHIVGYSP